MARTELTTAELNYLLIRYFKEKGYDKTERNFRKKIEWARFENEERLLEREERGLLATGEKPFRATEVLEKVMEKGLQFLTIEANQTIEEGRELVNLDQWDLITKTMPELIKDVEDEKARRLAAPAPE